LANKLQSMQRKLLRWVLIWWTFLPLSVHLS